MVQRENDTWRAETKHHLEQGVTVLNKDIMSQPGDPTYCWRPGLVASPTRCAQCATSERGAEELLTFRATHVISLVSRDVREPWKRKPRYMYYLLLLSLLFFILFLIVCWEMVSFVGIF